MKTIILLALTTILFSCNRYALLTSDKYLIVNRDQNTSKVKAKFEKSIQLELVVQDTIISSVNEKGTCKIDYIKRDVDAIPEGAEVKITEPTPNSFIVEFVDYKLLLPMILSKDGEFIINCNKSGVIPNSQYKVLDPNPKLVFKMKKRKSTQNISLKK
jgi:hypothetical protein